MATPLEDLRTKYPQYSDMSDLDLADAFHNKYYSDIPKKEYYTKIGLKPKQSIRDRLVEDVMGGVEEGIPMAWEMAKALPGEVVGATKQTFDLGNFDSPRAAQNLLSGTAKLGRGIANIPGNIVDAAKARGIGPDWLGAWRPTELNQRDYDQDVGLQGQQRGDALLQSIPELPLWGAGATAGLLGKLLTFAGLGAMHNENPVKLATGGKVFELGAKTAGKVGGKTIETVGKKGRELPPKVQELEAIAQKHGIDTFAGDLAPKGSKVQGLTESLEKPPFVNIKNERLKQQGQALEAANAMRDAAEKEMIAQNYSSNGMKNIEKAAAGNGKRAEAARRVLSQIEGAGEDWNYILKTSGNVKLLDTKLKADALYDRVGVIAKKHGNVDLGSTIKTVDKVISELGELPNTNKAEIAALNGFKKDLMAVEAGQPAGMILDASGNPIIAGTEAGLRPKDLNFNQVRAIRTDINAKINDYMTGKNTLVGENGISALKKVRESLGRDLDRFATSNGPELKEAWKAADTYYKENVIPFRDRTLIKALKAESNPDEIFKMFVKNGGAEGDFGTGRAQKFFKALDEKGQSAVRYGILKQAAQHATDHTGSFSPAKYATNLEKLAASRAVFFEGASKREVAALAKLMRHIERAGQMKTPDTGVKNLSAILGLAALQSGKAIPAAGVAMGLKWLVSSPKGKRLLLTNSVLKPGSKAYSQNLQKMADFIGEQAGKGGQAIILNKDED